ncbi:MAG: acetoin utilization protein, partial [Microvirga sp.]|nr:acetoin utilization protein [Microvirga sp.]
DPSVLYCSIHEMPLYPGTGAASETGEHGTILNAPMAPGDGSEVFRDLMERVVLPRMDAFQPDLLVVSAGFDAHWRDPLASISLTEADFGWATRKVMALADRRCAGRLVSILEGGYDLEALARSTAAHVDALMGRETKA